MTDKSGRRYHLNPDYRKQLLKLLKAGKKQAAKKSSSKILKKAKTEKTEKKTVRTGTKTINSKKRVTRKALTSNSANNSKPKKIGKADSLMRPAQI